MSSDGYFLGELRAPHKYLSGTLSLPKYLQSSVALRLSSVSSVVKKASFVVKKVERRARFA